MKIQFAVPSLPFPAAVKNSMSVTSAYSHSADGSVSTMTKTNCGSFADEDWPALALVGIGINGDKIFENIGASIDAGIDVVKTMTETEATEVTLNTPLEAIYAWESAVKAAFKRANDVVGKTVKNIDETVKTIAESEEVKNTKSKVDETVQTTMVKVSQYADQLAIQFLDSAAAALAEDESRNDVDEDAMSVVTDIRAA